MSSAEAGHVSVEEGRPYPLAAGLILLRAEQADIRRRANLALALHPGNPALEAVATEARAAADRIGNAIAVLEGHEALTAELDTVRAALRDACDAMDRCLGYCCGMDGDAAVADLRKQGGLT
jgi:hypothetical protein